MRWNNKLVLILGLALFSQSLAGVSPDESVNSRIKSRPADSAAEIPLGNNSTASSSGALKVRGERLGFSVCHSGSTVRFGSSSSTIGSEIVILAKGISGGETMELQIDQQTVSQWQVEADFDYFHYQSDELLSPDRIRVASKTQPPNVDDLTNGLVVDWIRIDGVTHQAESHSVYARGAEVMKQPARPGFYLTESLPFDGFFQFGISGTEDDFLQLQLNEALPDGWTFSFFSDRRNVWLRTQNAAGKRAFYSRFGSAGVISSIQDMRSRKQLIAPPFKKESTDRVLQWTVWETGSKVVHDIPSLPWFEDRFNITQAGTSRNLYHGTVEVALNSYQGQLDVWSIHDRQWKLELEPHVGGSLTSLTRVNVLDGGGMLVRRVIRIGKVTLHGEAVNLSEPLIEAWSPFADKAFDSIALDLNNDGEPTWWFADSNNIPTYPNWPVVSTRGWAIAYDRDQKSTGPCIAVVYGRDEGVVVLSDGSSTPPQSYYLNMMDFKGGMAILPGYLPGSLPEGSLVDLSFIFLPAHGIGEATAEMLDALASRLPAPRTYHPGAPLSGELSIIADRLSTLGNEKRWLTDQLGTVK